MTWDAVLAWRGWRSTAARRGPARWSPRVRSFALIMGGSLAPILPVLAETPLLPPLGFLAFVVWRLLRPDLLPPWSAIGFGLFDDLFSGNPLGTAVLCWTLVALWLEASDRWFPFRSWRQDWLVASSCGLIYMLALWALSPINGGAPVPLSMLALPALLTLALPPLLIRLATGPGDPDPRR